MQIHHHHQQDDDDEQLIQWICFIKHEGNMSIQSIDLEDFKYIH